LLQMDTDLWSMDRAARPDVNIFMLTNFEV
jgi:hypothetical protein